MRPNENVDQRLAAWLLTLPGPIAASDPELALETARRKFDRRIPATAFEQALHRWGYALRRRNAREFELSPLQN